MFRVSVRRRKRGALPELPNGTPRVKVGLIAGKADSDVISRGIYNEFGTRGGGWGGPIPERPFLRNAMRANRGAYQAAMRSEARAILRNKGSVQQVLRKLGVRAQGDVQREITTLRDPPNSPVTIARKGSSNPLIATGEMRQAITYEVEE